MGPKTEPLVVIATASDGVANLPPPVVSDVFHSKSSCVELLICIITETVRIYTLRGDTEGAPICFNSGRELIVIIPWFRGPWSTRE